MKKGISSNLKEIVVYLFVGGLTTVISWVSYALFEMLFSGVIANSVMLASVANVLSWIIAVAFAFITNKLWVFESKSFKAGVVLKEAGTFVASRVATCCLEWFGLPLVMLIGFDQALFGIEGMVAKVLISVIVVILNYVFSKLFVFKKKEK